MLLLVEFVAVVDPPELLPAPAPEKGTEDVAPSPHALSPSAPPLALESSPSPSPDLSPAPTPSSTPSLSDVRDVQHTSIENIDGEERESHLVDSKVDKRLR